MHCRYRISASYDGGRVFIVRDGLRWIFREIPKDDLGIDGYVEILREDRKSQGRLFAVQIKTGPSYLAEPNDDGFVYRGALKHELETTLQAWSVDDLTKRLQQHNVPCGRVRSMRQAVEHPQIEPRELLVRQTHPQFGAVTTLGPVVKLSRTPADVRLPPPALGEHTEEVLGKAGRQKSGKAAIQGAKAGRQE